MNIKVEQVQLKRLGQKLWQFRECEPKRVELAVLDYLASKGWRGYFTEHFNYHNTILCMMLWCNRESYFKEKRKTSEIFKHSNPAWYAFNHASDGFFEFKKHKFSHKQLMEHANIFSEDAIVRVLEVWKVRKIKSHIIGRAYLNSRSAEEIINEDLVSFYQARGGLQYFLNYIDFFYNPDLQELKNRARNLDNLILSMYDYNSSLRNLFLENGGNFLCIYKKKPPSLAALEEWISQINKHEKVELQDHLLCLACDIKKYWIARNGASNPWELTAVLDLEVWKDSVASVEVKAPNDHLKPHQRKQLELDAKLGRESWVIEVHE